MGQLVDPWGTIRQHTRTKRGQEHAENEEEDLEAMVTLWLELHLLGEVLIVGHVGWMEMKLSRPDGRLIDCVGGGWWRRQATLERDGQPSVDSGVFYLSLLL